MTTAKNTFLSNLDQIKLRFFERIDKNGIAPSHCPEIGKCWRWIGSKNCTGYAAFHVKGWNQQRASRVSWIIHFGVIPDGKNVLHKCDNRECNNPYHLFLGTQKENVADMIYKGRLACRKGESNGRSVVGESDVIEIRRLLKNGSSYRDIAARFNVVAGTVGHIKSGRTWRHVV